jgi:DNA repair ATPase RecN
MVTELKEVISTIEKLKDEEQREIAKMLSDEMNWDTTLQNSQEKLNNLAQEALNEYKSGKTKQTDW